MIKLAEHENWSSVKAQQLANIKSYNREAEIKLSQPYIAAESLDKLTKNPTATSESITTTKMNPKGRLVIRRRKQFVYSQANDYLANHDYWHREKRSLTKLHSNSLMYEYTRVQNGNSYHK